MSWIREDQGFEGEVLMVPSADMRYRGQSYEIDTQLEASWIESGSIDLMAKAFHELHEKIYEHSDTEAEVQINKFKDGNLRETSKTELSFS